MGYESFYGGRRGISFQIVARFDGVDIPQVEGHYVYKRKNYAYKLFENDDTKYYIYPFIEKDFSSFDNTDYHWNSVDLDGGEILTVAEDATSGESAVYRSLGDPVLAEGMTQCFAQGGATTDKVNYGEYVIIDTISDRNEYNNPDNGKIYRRGMDYIISEQNPFAGAEYIGCVVGPRGDITRLAVAGYNEVKDLPQSKTSSYVLEDGLVPGKTDEGTYNDAIKAAYVALRNSQGEIEECLCAFEFPFLVQEYLSRSISPYDASGQPLPADYELVKRIDDKTHPFYEKWQINIPKGIRGDSLSNWKIEPTVNRPNAKYWLREEDMDTEPADGTLEDTYPIVNINSHALTVRARDMIIYIKPNDGWKYKAKYLITNYDDSAIGESTEIVDEVTNYDIVNKIVLEENGEVTAYYSNRDPETSENKIRWINNMSIDTDGTGSSAEEGQGDQKVHVVYNTNPDVEVPIGKPLNYIIDSTVSQADATKNPDNVPAHHMLVYYSDPAKRTSSIRYFSPLKNKMLTGWIDMGNVRGPLEGLRLIGQVDTIQDLYDETTGKYKKPEEIDSELIIDTQGWGVVDSNNHFFAYDYIAGNTWTDIGSIDIGAVDVSKLFCISSASGGAPSSMAVNGIWGPYSPIKYAE